MAAPSPRGTGTLRSWPWTCVQRSLHLFVCLFFSISGLLVWPSPWSAAISATCYGNPRGWIQKPRVLLCGLCTVFLQHTADGKPSGSSADRSGLFFLQSVLSSLCTLGAHPQQWQDSAHVLVCEAQAVRGKGTFPENTRMKQHYRQKGCMCRTEPGTGCSRRRGLERTRQHIRICLVSGHRTRLQISVVPSSGLSNRTKVGNLSRRRKGHLPRRWTWANTGR